MKRLNIEISSKFRFIFESMPLVSSYYTRRTMASQPWFHEFNTMGYFERM